MTSTRTPSVFRFERRVAYYETDAMAVVHHSNYVRYFEDARVAWMRHSGLIKHHAPEGAFVFAVVDLKVNFKKPLRFDELFVVSVTVRLDGARLRLEYVLTRGDDVMATGETTLVPLDSQFRPARLPPAARALF